MINHLIFVLLSIFINRWNVVLCLTRYETTIQMTFDNLTDPIKYQKWIRPLYHSNQFQNYGNNSGPVYVNVSLDLYNFATVDEITSEYTFHLFLDLEWFDPRLEFPIEGNDNEVTIEGGQHHIDRIWTPTIFIPNNQDPGSFDYDHESANFVRVKANGYVWLRKRKLLRIYCNMDFHLYPFDEQICDLHLESSISTVDNLVLQWNSNQNFSKAESFRTIGFNLGETTTTTSIQKYSKNNLFSRASLKFGLAREWEHHIFLFYLPSGIIVVASWSSFWLEITSPPARASIGVTTMLALVTTFKSTKSQLPNVSYWNALDIWNMVCIVFIFSSLFEFAVVNYIFNTEKRKKRHKKLETKRRNTIMRVNENIINNKRRMSSLTTLDSTVYQSTVSTYEDLNRKLSDFCSQSRKSSNCPELDFNQKKEPTFEASKRRRSSIGLDLLKPMPNIREEPSGCRSRRQSAISLTGQPLTTKLVIGKYLKLTPEELAYYIDHKCRRIFPLTFLMFNLIYWTVLQIKF